MEYLYNIYICRYAPLVVSTKDIQNVKRVLNEDQNQISME